MNLHIDPSVFLGLASTPSPANSTDRENPAALREVCQKFEAIFIQSMFKGMRATVSDGGLLDKGLDTEIFEEMMDQEVARELAGTQSVGIAASLFEQLQKETPDKK